MENEMTMNELTLQEIKFLQQLWDFLTTKFTDQKTKQNEFDHTVVKLIESNQISSISYETFMMEKTASKEIEELKLQKKALEKQIEDLETKKNNLPHIKMKPQKTYVDPCSRTIIRSSC